MLHPNTPQTNALSFALSPSSIEMHERELESSRPATFGALGTGDIPRPRMMRSGARVHKRPRRSAAHVVRWVRGRARRRVLRSPIRYFAWQAWSRLPKAKQGPNRWWPCRRRWREMRRHVSSCEVVRACGPTSVPHTPFVERVSLCKSRRLERRILRLTAEVDPTLRGRDANDDHTHQPP